MPQGLKDFMAKRQYTNFSYTKFNLISRYAVRTLSRFRHSPVDFHLWRNLSEKKLIKLYKLNKFSHFCVVN